MKIEKIVRIFLAIVFIIIGMTLGSSIERTLHKKEIVTYKGMSKIIEGYQEYFSASNEYTKSLEAKLEKAQQYLFFLMPDTTYMIPVPVKYTIQGIHIEGKRYALCGDTLTLIN